ncbi:XRE family transcriptional regulator [Pedobacter frigidisoli]|uniref:XRE family transcriptional regulator n=1 Tax=Pedobacter frigidisoli TaxID=2530455 RepID=A0A4R0NYU3_9SPHI|nr:XRE family transcriptional regulator [Pedobacter frigidisoli]TCD07620.1 XRE family transcriptional regulator [Pedobacter frigidisoli]
MDKRKRELIIGQLDSKLAAFKPAAAIIRPERGWVNAIRTSLNMPLNALGIKLNTTPQGVKNLELREQSGSITLNALKEVAECLDMKLVYALVPKDESLGKMIEQRAYEMAKKIVMRTSASMRLEDQENTKERLSKSIIEKAEDIKDELPKYLWL